MCVKLQYNFVYLYVHIKTNYLRAYEPPRMKTL